MGLARNVIRFVLAVGLLIGCQNKGEQAPPAPTPRAPRVLHLVKQRGPSDCGDAAIAMTLDYYGKPAALDAIEHELPPGADGVSALQLLKLAESRGLGVEGVKVITPRHASLLRAGDILHVDEHHFVVVDHVSDDGIHVLDPDSGPDVVALTDPTHPYRAALVFADTPAALDERLHPTVTAPQ
jgi:ABC-type bacteriocin/lantibiotic exporter with double-glycine peptidase domain